MENNENHQITLPKGRIGFSFLDVVDQDEPKYQIRSPYELTNAIISSDQRYNDCLLLHSTVPSQSSDEFLQIINGTDVSIIQQPNSIGHCISGDARMSKSFSIEQNPWSQINMPKSKTLHGTSSPFLGFNRRVLNLQFVI